MDVFPEKSVQELVATTLKLPETALAKARSMQEGDSR